MNALTDVWRVSRWMWPAAGVRLEATEHIDIDDQPQNMLPIRATQTITRCHRRISDGRYRRDWASTTIHSRQSCDYRDRKSEKRKSALPSRRCRPECRLAYAAAVGSAFARVIFGRRDNGGQRPCLFLRTVRSHGRKTRIQYFSSILRRSVAAVSSRRLRRWLLPVCLRRIEVEIFLNYSSSYLRWHRNLA